VQGCNLCLADLGICWVIGWHAHCITQRLPAPRVERVDHHVPACLPACLRAWLQGVVEEQLYLPTSSPSFTSPTCSDGQRYQPTAGSPTGGTTNCCGSWTVRANRRTRYSPACLGPVRRQALQLGRQQGRGWVEALVVLLLAGCLPSPPLLLLLGLKHGGSATTSSPGLKPSTRALCEECDPIIVHLAQSASSTLACIAYIRLDVASGRLPAATPTTTQALSTHRNISHC
jgi:hypothetical protein